jgi:hypothetical protein
VVTLRRGTSARITVIDDRGEPVSRAHVTIMALRDNWWQPFRDGADTDARGVGVVHGLDPDEKVILQVQPPEERSALLEFQRRDWNPADLTVTLPTGHFVRGVVLDSSGDPVPDAVVCGDERNLFTLERRVDVEADGTFEVGPFPAGEVWLLALPSDVASWDSREPWTKVEAGAEGVVLVRKTGWTLKARIGNLEDEERWRVDVQLRLAPGPFEEFTWESTRTPWDGDRLVFQNLEVGRTYSLFLRLEERGLFALHLGITEATSELDLQLVPGQTVQGRLLLPPDHPHYAVMAEGPGFEVDGELRKDGTFEIRGVPTGPCRLGVEASTANTQSGSYHPIEEGEYATIDLR